MNKGWIGCDLDGTLAHYEGWNDGKIGAPILKMVHRVRAWLAEGHAVKIVTARVAPNQKDAAMQTIIIQDWCREHIGMALPVTATKDYAMIQLYDDRCVQVIANTGKLVIEYPYPNEQAAAVLLNLAEEEAIPRGETWLHERANWQREVEELRATVAAMQKTIEVTHLFDERERLYVMKVTQDRIQIEKDIAAFDPEKKAALDRFVEQAPQMTYDELDAVIGAFGDPEGTYVQRYTAGKEAIDRWNREYRLRADNTRSQGGANSCAMTANPDAGE